MDSISQQAAKLSAEWATDPRGRAPRGPTRPRTWSGCAARCRRSTRWPGCGAERLRELLAREDYSHGPRRDHRQPGGPAGPGRPQGHLPVRLAGGGGRATWPGRPTRTRASTRSTRCRRWSAGSTTRCCGPTRSAGRIRDGDASDFAYWLAPIVADAEAGFGGVLNAFELMKSMIAAGAAGVHWEDQLSSEKKCGHLGGKVLIPTGQHIKTLNAARLAADVCGVPTLIVARTDAAGGHPDHH